MDKLSATPALDGWRVMGAAITVAENTDFGLLRVQTFDRDSKAVERLGAQLGLELPGPGETQSDASASWYWAGPGNWIVAVTAGSEAAEAERLEQQSEGLLVAVSVVTDSRVVLEIAGSATSDLLARGSTVDFHPRSFTAGRCVNTRFAGLTVMLARVVDGERVYLFADRSFATYLSRWIEAASLGC